MKGFILYVDHKKQLQLFSKSGQNEKNTIHTVRFFRASQLCFKSTSKAFFTFPIIYLVYPNPQSRQIARLFLLSSELGLSHPNAGECVPPPFGSRGRDKLACEIGGWGTQFGRGTDTLVLWVYMYSTLCPNPSSDTPHPYIDSSRLSSERLTPTYK